ncbi:MAG TPA: HD domain-containing phosphohydrolase [Egibacteraceae bacterium]|nr:HD domain-containing phosphohydrolase [Egibacteraceae bacterium]
MPDGGAGEDARERRPGTEPAGTGAPVRTLLVEVPAPVRARLEETGAHTFVDGPDDADVVVVSTRMPRGELMAALSGLRGRARGKVVVLVHTGGEGLAVEVMRAGAAGVIGEGNEDAVAALAAGTGHDTGLITTYERKLAQARGGRDALRNRDPLTGEPTGAAFAQRLTELSQAGQVPRIAFLRLLHLPGTEQRAAADATLLVRRRLAVAFRQLAERFAVELFTLGPADHAVLGMDLAPDSAEELGLRLGRVARRFAPNGYHPLALAMGHAGAEAAAQVATVRELAHRALEVAAADKDGGVVAADTLSLGVSSTTELEAALRMLAHVERHDAYPPGHGERVAELAGELAWRLGYDGQRRTRIQLAALLHDVGKIAVAPEAIAGAGDHDGPLAEAYRSHPARGADYLRPSAGDEVAAAVRGHHERWDGGGFPDGLSGHAIPLAARIIAVADAVERLTHTEGPADPPAIATALSALAGTSLDPDLVAVALPLVDPAQPAVPA